MEIILKLLGPVNNWTHRFAENSNDYNSSEIKPFVDAYKDAVEARIGTTVQEARLLLYEEAQALVAAGHEDKLWICGGTTGYWLGTPVEGSTKAVWAIQGNTPKSSFDKYNSWQAASMLAVRPVIVISK